MTNKLFLVQSPSAFGLTLRFGWFDQCKRNRINLLAASSRSRRRFVS
jgi:hypothetical protein